LYEKSVFCIPKNAVISQREADGNKSIKGDKEMRPYADIVADQVDPARVFGVV
jgi:hypothetical protein